MKKKLSDEIRQCKKKKQIIPPKSAYFTFAKKPAKTVTGRTRFANRHSRSISLLCFFSRQSVSRISGRISSHAGHDERPATSCSGPRIVFEPKVDQRLPVFLMAGPMMMDGAGGRRAHLSSSAKQPGYASPPERNHHSEMPEERPSRG